MINTLCEVLMYKIHSETISKVTGFIMIEMIELDNTNQWEQRPMEE